MGTTTTGQHTHDPRSRKEEYITYPRQKVLAEKMFTAGNMTYMRKRKKERQAAKRAMARENAILDAMEEEREEQELAEALEKENEPVEFYDVCNNGGKPKRRTFTTD